MDVANVKKGEFSVCIVVIMLIATTHCLRGKPNIPSHYNDGQTSTNTQLHTVTTTVAAHTHHIEKHTHKHKHKNTTHTRYTYIHTYTHSTYHISNGIDFWPSINNVQLVGVPIGLNDSLTERDNWLVIVDNVHTTTPAG